MDSEGQSQPRRNSVNVASVYRGSFHDHDSDNDVDVEYQQNQLRDAGTTDESSSSSTSDHHHAGGIKRRNSLNVASFYRSKEKLKTGKQQNHKRPLHTLQVSTSFIRQHTHYQFHDDDDAQYSVYFNCYSAMNIPYR